MLSDETTTQTAWDIRLVITTYGSGFDYPYLNLC